MVELLRARLWTHRPIGLCHGRLFRLLLFSFGLRGRLSECLPQNLSWRATIRGCGSGSAANSQAHLDVGCQSFGNNLRPKGTCRNGFLTPEDCHDLLRPCCAKAIRTGAE